MITRAAALSRVTSPEVRFWRKVRLTPYHWEWVAAKNDDGYGVFFDGQKVVLATRWLFKLVYGDTELPDDKQAAHHCDWPPCVRPTHLFAATVGQNVADMLAKGRGAPPPLRAHRKLSDDQIQEIRSTYTGAYGQQAALARQYEVSQNCISRLVRGVTWAT